MAKKIEKEIILYAQSELINSFINTLNFNTKEQYRQVVNALALDDVYTKQETKNFIKYLFETPKREDKLKLIDSLIEDKENYKWNGNGKKSYSTYLNRFIKFLKQNIDIVTEIEQKYKITQDKELIFSQSVLYTKFKSRLRCQDRTSGDKIWLPLRFISKLYSIAKKNGDIQKNLFLEWLDSLVDDIYVQYFSEETNTIKSVNFKEKKGKNIALVLKIKDEKKGLYDVYVRISNKKSYTEFPAYTPTGKGNKKEPMCVKGISEIDIDHIKPIDQTLRDYEKDLNELKKVSDYYKGIHDLENIDLNNAAKALLSDIQLDLDKLYDELKKIKYDGILRLMSSKYNSKKSNGETFQSIIKCSDTVYWGIVEKEEEIKDEDENRVYLMQKLTNTLNDENGFRVKKTLPQGTEIKDRKDLIEIINYI